MRIESSQTYSSYGQRGNGHSSSELFELTLMDAEKKEEKSGKPEEKKGKLVTAREGAYVRQYLVGADGSKILINETKQAEEETAAAGNYAPPSLRGANLSESGMSRNNKEMINLLNLQAGAGIPLPPNKGLIQAEK